MQPPHRDKTKDDLENESSSHLDESATPKNPLRSDDSFLFQRRVASISPQKVTEFISNHFVKGNDDALVTVVKYLGKG